MASSETLRSVIDAGRTSRRLDELSAARVIGKAAQQVHAAQQKAGAGKSVGPISPTAIALSATGEVSLTLPATSSGYAAPEQATGGAGDRRSDVFSLGVVMWEALTYQRLFEAMNDAAVKAAIAEREIKPPSELNANIPAELSAICMRALTRNSADRYQSAKAMGVEIEEFLEEAGYPDDDEQIATFLAQLGEPKQEKKLTLPPPTRIAPVTAPTAPAPAPAAMAAASVQHEKSSTAPGLGPSVLVAPGPAASARTANGTSPPLVPMAPVLPGASIVAKPEAPKVEAPKVEAPKIELPKPEPAKAEASTNGEATKPPAAQTMLGIAPPDAPAPPSPIAAPAPAPATLPSVSAAPTVPLSAVAPPEPKPATGPSKTVDRSDPTPSPASVVALPGRESGPKDVLAGWGWGTDAHEAIDDSDFHAHPPNNKKLLLWLIGGGVMFTAMVAVIAFGFGGSKKKHAPPPVATTQEGSSAAIGTPDLVAGSGSSAEPTGSAVAVADTTGSAVAAIDTTGSAAPVDPNAGSAMTATTTGSAAGSAQTGTGTTAIAAVGSAAGTGTTAGSAAVATTGPINPYPDTPNTTKPGTTKKPDTTKPDAAKKPDKIAKTETPKVETTKPARTDTTKTTKPPTRTDVAKTTKPDPTKATKPARTDAARTTKPDKPEQKGDAEAAYKAGIMQFARGDTTGALAQLRTSLAANPNYAPTWRGLGLVFEKLGEKDQARAAFKRYLQLAPSAGDGEQIRSRMERLGS